MVPYFDIQKYFDNLRMLSGGDIKFGSILGYSEVITSTNTIMDKNPQWLEHLPNGFTITATTQIAGRGRGGNVWVNPAVSLQRQCFSKYHLHPRRRQRWLHCSIYVDWH